MTFSGGLRGLRPPATFFATLRVAEVSQLYSYPHKARFKPRFGEPQSGSDLRPKVGAQRLPWESDGEPTTATGLRRLANKKDATPLEL